jgi:hypothetical protein
MINYLNVKSNEYNEADKYRLMELIKSIVKISLKARRDGLLSLDSEYPSIQSYLFRKGIEMVTEGASSEDIIFIFNNYSQTKKYSGKEFLEILIIRDSLLFIQNGDNGKILFEKIISMLGEGFSKDFDYAIIDKEILLEERSKYEKQITKEKTSEEMIFEEMILNINNSIEMEKLIVLIGGAKFALSLKGCSSKVENHIKDLCAHHIYKVIEEYKDFLGPVRIIDVLDAQKSILMKVNK